MASYDLFPQAGPQTIPAFGRFKPQSLGVEIVVNCPVIKFINNMQASRLILKEEKQ